MELAAASKSKLVDSILVIMNLTKSVCLFSLPNNKQPVPMIHIQTSRKQICAHTLSNNCHKKTIHLGQDLTPISVSFDSGGFLTVVIPNFSMVMVSEEALMRP
ncbi:hypothetical protein Hanom_Chr05g00422921 [Helianthus anomalus]